jgi:uncharacterized repeat protein (TIGR01451 family)
MMVRTTLAAGALALVALLASAGPAQAQSPPPNTCVDKETFFWFVYADGTTDTGCATKNDVVTPNAPRLHVSCSDPFTNGIPSKSVLLPGKVPVRQFFISKDGGKKTCGALPPSPPEPPDVKVKKSASSSYVYEYGVVTFTITVENAGGGTAANVVLTDRLAPGFIFLGASPGCSYNAVTSTVTCQAGDLAGGGSAVPTSNPCPGKQTYFRFQYTDGLTDEGCGTKNDVTAAEVPGLVANELHISCSDTFTNGVPRKSDIGNRRVAAYLIIKGDGKKTCGEGTFRPPKKTFQIRVKVKKDGCNVAKAKWNGQHAYSNEVCVRVKRPYK